MARSKHPTITHRFARASYALAAKPESPFCLDDNNILKKLIIFESSQSVEKLSGTSSNEQGWNVF